MLDRVTATASALVRAAGAAADRLLAPPDGVAPDSAGGPGRPLAPRPDSSAQGQSP